MNRQKIKKIILIFLIIILTMISGIFIYKLFNKNKENNNNNSVIEETPKEDQTITKLKKEEYYISRNLDRYLMYIQKYPDKSMKDVISSVNANIDYEYYTHSMNATIEDAHLMLVNKYYKLSSDYVPNLVTMSDQYNHNPNAGEMEVNAYEHFKEMVDAALKDNIILYNVSAYRSYNTQNTVYNNYVVQDGIKAADTYSARPSYSEHQTGYSSDINTSSSRSHFENSQEYAWLQENSYKYGFILRFPKNKENLTGYKYEPWNYRYVGIEAANYIHEHDITLEEYYAYFVEKK